MIVDAAKRSEQRPLIGGTIKAFRDIVTNEGVFRGLYRGVTPNIAGATASWGFYFWWYETLSIFLMKAGIIVPNGIKNRYSLIKKHMKKDENGKLSAIQHLTASAEGGRVMIHMFGRDMY